MKQVREHGFCVAAVTRLWSLGWRMDMQGPGTLCSLSQLCASTIDIGGTPHAQLALNEWEARVPSGAVMAGATRFSFIKIIPFQPNSAPVGGFLPRS